MPIHEISLKSITVPFQAMWSAKMQSFLQDDFIFSIFEERAIFLFPSDFILK